MISEKMFELGNKRSVIRELFEYGKARAAQIGAENVFDFTIGNPSIPAPSCVKEIIIDLLENADPVLLHGYTSATGDIEVRKSVSEYINNTYGTKIGPGNIYMTSGAAASLSICIKAITIPEESADMACGTRSYEPEAASANIGGNGEQASGGDEVVTFAPFFPEYKVFTEAAGAAFKYVLPGEDFQIDFDDFLKVLNERTKAVIVNSPNNPSGVVYSIKTIKELCRILKEKSEEYGHPIYLISDEPYRELVYDDIEVPYLMNYYENTFVCYSYSKSLSLPGERIGYIAVSDKMEDWQRVYLAICGAGRALGYVCASSMYQQVIARCHGMTSNISIYKENRDLLYEGLTKLGYTCVRPDGAFYLFVKAPAQSDAKDFSEKAKKYDVLFVPGDDFGCPGYVRIAYCTKREQIERAMPAFAKIIKEYE